MKFSEQWLRTWINPDIDQSALLHQLTMAGLEVATTEPVAKPFSEVVVGQIKQKNKHPDADSLFVCQVDIGQSEPIQIVTNLNDVAIETKLPVALIGASLPGDLKIKKTKLRGVESFGMFCSIAELITHEWPLAGIQLPNDASIGQPIADYLALNDTIIDIELTPNRGDCLSISGIAREVAALTGSATTAPTPQKITPTIDDTALVELDATEDCPRYISRIIKQVDCHNAETPLWMQLRLIQSGVNCISPVVDIINYVMLELGQPMHAFDYNKINTPLTVRRANSTDKIELLDGQSPKLTKETLLIADKTQPVAMAGIMGGNISAVTETTTDLLLESAYFNPSTITKAVQHYQIHSESSHRFERTVDPQLQSIAIERATQLILDIVGGKPGPCHEVVSTADLPPVRQITLRRDRIAKMIGITLDDDIIIDCLTRLAFVLEETIDGWLVTVPSYRADITIEIDLIEEITRLYGYENIPENYDCPLSLPNYDIRGELELHNDIARFMAARDYQEAITFSFVDPKLQSILLPEQPSVHLANPISADLAQMRLSLWPGLIQALKYNQNRQQPRTRLFEIGMTFVPEEDGSLQQSVMLAGAISGAKTAEQWSDTAVESDFFDLKNDLHQLFKTYGLANHLTWRAKTHSSLHPGQSAQIYLGDTPIGWIGQCHPALADQLGLKSNLFVFEITVDALTQQSPTLGLSPSKFPQVRRDIAVVVDEATQSQALLDCCRQNASTLLQDLVVFDVYQGQGIENHQKSIAIGLTLGHDARTLSDAEVDAVVDGILQGLKDQFNASLRS